MLPRVTKNENVIIIFTCLTCVGILSSEHGDVPGTHHYSKVGILSSNGASCQSTEPGDWSDNYH